MSLIFRLSWRNLFHDRLRFIATVIGKPLQRLQVETTNDGEEIMHKLAVVTTAVLCGAAVSSTPSYAAVGHSIAATIDAIGAIEKAGCYRLGETGYHWYRFCFGPTWLYPHQRVCRHGSCWYR